MSRPGPGIMYSISNTNDRERFFRPPPVNRANFSNPRDETRREAKNGLRFFAAYYRGPLFLKKYSRPGVLLTYQEFRCVWKHNASANFPPGIWFLQLYRVFHNLRYNRQRMEGRKLEKFHDYEPFLSLSLSPFVSLLTCYDPQLFSFDSWCRIKSIVSTIPKRQEQRNGWRKNKALETRANWRGAFDRGNFLADPCQRRFVLRSPSDCPRGDICARCSKFREFVRVEWWRLISRIWAKPSGVVAKNWHYFLIRSADTFLYLLKRLILRLDHLSSCWIFIDPEILRKISANES